MTFMWETIAQSLRDELQEYGGLLGLFEDQQEALFRRDSSALTTGIAPIDRQIRSGTARRERREELVRNFALSVGMPPDATLRALLPHFPPEVRPLLMALIDEVNHLVRRIHRHARQNSMLLQRTIELHQEALQMLRPESFTRTYSACGAVSIVAPGDASSRALQAVG